MGARPMEALAAASSGQLPTRQVDKAEMRDIVHEMDKDITAIMGDVEHIKESMRHKTT